MEVPVVVVQQVWMSVAQVCLVVQAVEVLSKELVGMEEEEEIVAIRGVQEQME